MAKRFRKKKAFDSSVSSPVTSSKVSLLSIGVTLLLAVVTFLAYWPSLKSGFVYDARIEILEEGFITSLSNLPDVLSLKVLGMNLTLASRPGQMLYLMLNAAIWGRHPFGYHLSSNLLHAANVALLFVLLGRLIATEITGLTRGGVWKVQLAAAVVVSIFALHPIAVESVAEVSYSSSLLVTFFTLLALLAATAFRPENFRVAMMIGGVGTLCAFGAVTSKESGVMTVPLLFVYWFLFRRREAKLPWFLFLSVAGAVTAAFLAARFLLAPPAPHGLAPLSYLGGSFSQVFLLQPRLWVFMMGKLLWPTDLSADYAPVDEIGPSAALSLVILGIVVSLQAWLACKNRIGALGVAIYWLGLATVSNFIPLNRPEADRFYYLSLAGFAMQLLALLLMTLGSHRRFWMTMAPCMAVILPLTFLTLVREKVFADEFSLWTDTLQVSPLSSVAHNCLGMALFQRGQMDDAIAQYQKALEIEPGNADVDNNLGAALSKKGQVDEAIAQYQKVLRIVPNLAAAHYNLGIALFQKGQKDEAMAQYLKTLEINPRYIEAHINLGNMFFEKGQMDEAMAHYQKALEINPDLLEAHYNLGNIFSKQGQMDEAMAQYQKALEINPNLAQAHYSLGLVLFKKGQVDKALIQFQEVVRLDPDNKEAQNNLARMQAIIDQRLIPK